MAPRVDARVDSFRPVGLFGFNRTDRVSSAELVNDVEFTGIVEHGHYRQIGLALERELSFGVSGCGCVLGVPDSSGT